MIAKHKVPHVMMHVNINQGFFQGAGGTFAPLALAYPPWEFCSDGESIQVF